MLDPATLRAVAGLVDNLRLSCRNPFVGTSLLEFLGDQDTELFLILPRLLCLSVAADMENSNDQRALLEHLLLEKPDDEAAHDIETDILNLRILYRDVARMFGVMTWDALVARAVSGDLPADVLSKATMGLQGNPASAVVHALMQSCEKFSMEVQRRCPHKWNQCAEVVLRCMADENCPPMETFQI